MKKVILVTLWFVLFFFIGIWVMHKLIKRNELIRNEFDLEVKGILIEKKSIDRNKAKCKLLVLDSNYEEYRGDGPFGGTVSYENDILFLTLILDHCLYIKDTIIIGPNSRYIIINDIDTLYINGVINRCEEFGRVYPNTRKSD